MSKPILHEYSSESAFWDGFDQNKHQEGYIGGQVHGTSDGGLEGYQHFLYHEDLFRWHPLKPIIKRTPATQITKKLTPALRIAEGKRKNRGGSYLSNIRIPKKIDKKGKKKLISRIKKHKNHLKRQIKKCDTCCKRVRRKKTTRTRKSKK